MKLLASINEFTTYKGELKPEIYFVVLKYNTGIVDKEFEDLVNVSLGESIDKWFNLQVTPNFYPRKRHPHQFLGGLPIYYGDPGDVSSIYLAVIDSDSKSRRAADTMKDFFKGEGNDAAAKALIDQVVTMVSASNPKTAIIKQAFDLLTNVLQLALAKNTDDIQYANVFTFKKSNNYLAGKHDCRNQRMELELEIETDA